MRKYNLATTLLIAYTTVWAASAYPQTDPRKNASGWSSPFEAAIQSKPKLIGDYVPCVFDLDEEGNFRNIKLPGAEERERAAAAEAVESSDLLNKSQKADLKGQIFSLPLNLSAKTPTERRAVIQELTNKVVTDPASAQKVAESASTRTEMTAAEFTPPQRPPNVSCGMSVLPWSIARWTFGREVAENFVAVQVTVRNLSNDSQFLVHDVELAVDTQPGVFSRFRSGVDQGNVHGVAANAEEGWSSRAFWLRIATFVGAVASAANIPVRASGFRQTVGAYQGGLIPGLNKFLKDHTQDQISYLDASAFTNSQSRKIVVPKNDSATFYTFIPVKPILQIAWETIYKFKTGTEQIQNGSTFLLNKERAYKKWSSLAIEGFEGSTYVVVAGKHIQETEVQPTFSSLSCQPDGSATIDLSKIPTGPATCRLKGANLQAVAKVILQNATDPSDHTYADGTPSVSGGDFTQATVNFSTDDLKKLKGKTYKIYYSIIGGTPQSTDLAVTVQ